jgi:RNA recognition motif-containing protein
MAKEGLLNEETWIHKDAIPKSMMEARQRMNVAKQKALKNSTNLFVSKTRLHIRNLPRREFYEPELKELMRVVADEWGKTLSEQAQKDHYKNKKLLSQLKVMKDDQKTDQVGESLASGQAFVEFRNADLALFAVRYLNNLEIAGKNRGLIVDFSMED